MILKITLVFLFCLILGVYFFSFPHQIFAARNLTISSNKTSIFGDEELTINASYSGFIDGETIYIKGSFYQEGNTNYFGFTKKEETLIKSGDTIIDQRLVKIGEWDKNLIIKSDFTDGGYKGEGEYKLKAGFYYTTSGGNLSSVNWSTNNLVITISEPDPTPTSTPTNTPVQTLTSTPKPTNTPTPTVKSSISPTKILTSINKESSSTAILGESTGKNNLTPTVKTEKTKISPTIAIKNSKSTNPVPTILIGLDIISLAGCCGILTFKAYRRKLKDNQGLINSI